MKIGWNEWASLHWRRLDPETRGRSLVNGSAAAIGGPAGIRAGRIRCGQRNWDVSYNLRNRHPVRHAFTAGKIRKLDAALGDITLQVSQRIRAILVEFALNVIFHPSLTHSAKTQAGAVLFHNTNFDDGPYPGNDAEIAQRQYGEAELAYGTAHVSCIKVVYAQSAKKDAKNNVGCPALVRTTIDRRNICWRCWIRRWRCNLSGRRSDRLRQTQRPTVTRWLIPLYRSRLHRRSVLHRSVRLDWHRYGAQIALRNLQLGIVGGRALTAENSTAAIFLVAIFMVWHATGGAKNPWRRGLITRHAAIRADRLGHYFLCLSRK